MSKAFWTSKTFWTLLLGFLFNVATATGVVDAGTGQVYVNAVLLVLAGIFRWVATGPLTVSSSGS